MLSVADGDEKVNLYGEDARSARLASKSDEGRAGGAGTERNFRAAF